MSKTCHEVIELMNLYLDGRLSGGQYQELAKHQATCEHCRKRMNYLRVISSEIRNDRPAVPADLHNRIMQYIDQAEAPAPEVKAVKKRKPLVIGAVAAALALVLVGSFALKQMGTPGDVSGPDAAKEGGWFERFLGQFKGNQGANENQDPDPSSDDAQDGTQTGVSDDADKEKDKVAADKTEGTYVVPALHTQERFAQYVVATGTVVDLRDYFAMESVRVYPEDGSIYVCIPNQVGALADAYIYIRQKGLTLHVDPKGLPATDANAPEILFVIFPQ